MVRSVFVLFIASVFSLVSTPTPLPPPDPATIFVDGVQHEPYEEIHYVPANDRLEDIDWQAKVIRIRDSVDAPWQEFPFPAEMDNVYCVEKRSDGTWLVQQGNCDTPTSHLTDNDRRILHPDTGIYTVPELICKHEVKSLPGEGYWVYIEDTDRKLSLCFTETGELRNNLPDDVFMLYWGSFAPQSNIPDLSPDGKYLVLHLYPEESRPNSVNIYSYELATDQVLLLGEIDLYPDYPNSLGLNNWLDDTHGVFVYLGDEISLHFYGFNVTRSDSVEHALTGFDYFDEITRRYESVLSYYQVSMESGSRGKYFPCTLYTYDVNGPAEYELADNCVELIPEHDAGSFKSYKNAYRVGNRYYYLAVDKDDNTVSHLSYFDLETMTVHRTYLQGEIEKIGSISPDGRYVLLEFGSDLQLDNLEYCCRMAYDGAWMAIYDLEADPFEEDPFARTGQLARNGFVYVTGPAAYGSSRWLDNRTLLLNIEYSALRVRAIKPDEDGEFGTFGVSQIGYELIKINNDDSTTAIGVDQSTVFDEAYSENISPDGTYMLFQRGVLNPQTFEYTPVIREDVPDDYSYQVSWEAGDMIVSVFPPGYASGVDPLAKYRVILP